MFNPASSGTIAGIPLSYMMKDPQEAFAQADYFVNLTRSINPMVDTLARNANRASENQNLLFNKPDSQASQGLQEPIFQSFSSHPPLFAPPSPAPGLQTVSLPQAKSSAAENPVAQQQDNDRHNQVITDEQDRHNKVTSDEQANHQRVSDDEKARHNKILADEEALHQKMVQEEEARFQKTGGDIDLHRRVLADEEARHQKIVQEETTLHQQVTDDESKRHQGILQQETANQAQQQSQAENTPPDKPPSPLQTGHALQYQNMLKNEILQLIHQYQQKDSQPQL